MPTPESIYPERNISCSESEPGEKYQASLKKSEQDTIYILEMNCGEVKITEKAKKEAQNLSATSSISNPEITYSENVSSFVTVNS